MFVGLLAVLVFYGISAHHSSFSQSAPYAVESVFSFLLLHRNHWMFCTTVRVLTTYCHKFLQYPFTILFQLHSSPDKRLLDLYS